MKHTMKKLLILLFSLTTVLGFSQGETKVPLTQLYQTGATTGQVPKWDGTKWAAGDILSVSGVTAGTYKYPSVTVDVNGRVTAANSSSYLNDNANGLFLIGITNSNFIIGTGTAKAIPGVALRNYGFGDVGSTTMTNTSTDNIFIGQGPGSSLTGGAYNVAIGNSAFINATTAGRSIAIGYEALMNVTTNNGNVGVGWDAGRGISSGGNNFAFGQSSIHGIGSNYITGDGNVGIGASSLMYIVGTSSNNIGIGQDAGIGKSTGAVGGYNIAIGYRTFYNRRSGDNNIAIGTTALYNVTTANANIAIGASALQSDTTGGSNIAIGYEAGYLNVIGNENSFIGSAAGRSVTTSQNTGIGSGSLRNQKTGIGNVGVGYEALYSTPTGNSGNFNTGIGYRAMYNKRTNDDNVAIGTQAGFGWTTSSKNVAIGRDAVYSDTSSSEIVGIGYRAGFYQMNAQNTFIGAYAGEGVSGANIFGATYIGYEAGRFINNNNCTYIGNGAGKGTSGSSTGDANVGIGVNAFNKITIASTSVAIGNLAGANITSSNANTLIGYTAGSALTTSTSSGQNTLIGTGAGSSGPVMLNCTAIGFYALGGTGSTSTSSDIAIGSYALQLITTGNNNIAIGHDGLKNTSTGVRNTTIGNGAGFTNTTSSENTYIGALSGYYATGGNNTFIGSSSGKGINTIAFTGSNNTAIGFQTISSIRGAASNNGAIGANALYSMRNANRNYAFGTSALYADTTGSENMAIGHYSMGAITDGAGNAALGDISMYQATGNSSYNVAIGKNSLNGAFNFQHNTALGYLAGSGTSAGRTGGVYIGSGAGYGSTVDGALYIDKNTTPTSNKAPLIGGIFSSLWVGINTLPENLSASLEITSASNTFSTKTLEFNNSSGTNILDLRDNGNMGMSITAQSANKLAVQQSGSGTQVALLLRNGVDEDGQGIALDLNNAGIVHGRIVATNPTGSLTSALDLMTPDNSGTLSSFHTMQRDGSQNQLHKAIYYDVYSGTSTTETLTGLVTLVNIPSTATTTTINLPEIVSGVPSTNQVNIGYILELSIENASAITIQRAGTSDVIMVNGSTSTVTSITTTGGTYYVKRYIAVELNKWVVF